LLFSLSKKHIPRQRHIKRRLLFHHNVSPIISIKWTKKQTNNTSTTFEASSSQKKKIQSHSTERERETENQFKYLCLSVNSLLHSPPHSQHKLCYSDLSRKFQLNWWFIYFSIMRKCISFWFVVAHDSSSPSSSINININVY
jgi:hypothetical protein